MAVIINQFLISAVAAPGTDRLCCRKPFAAPGAGLIPPGPAQGAKGIVTGMLLAADRAAELADTDSDCNGPELDSVGRLAAKEV